jgi:tannase/feruloyl esterase
MTVAFRRYKQSSLLALASALPLLAFSSPAAAAQDANECPLLSKLQLPHTTINSATLVSSAEATALRLTSGPVLPDFCRVVAHVRSAPDSDIGIEIWLPVTGWTGVFHGNGNGGFAGDLQAGYGGMVSGLRRGFATAVTDTGTAPATALDGDPLIGHPRKWKDWGRLSTHVMTVTAKAITKAYYGRGAVRSYYSGCSTGGQQGLIEALYYPADYDGILVGAPVVNRTWTHAAVVWDYAAANRLPGSRLSEAKLRTLNAAAIASCNRRGFGRVGDAYISNPLACRFDPAEVTCKGPESDQCLTPAQVETARAFYSGPRRGDGRPAFFGWLPGSEFSGGFGWSFLQTAYKGQPQFSSLFRWVFGGNWDWRAFDVDRDMAIVDATLGPDVNDATRGSLRAFAKRGGKLIIYHGMADALVAPGQSVAFYERQAREMGGMSRLRRSARLFMVPGFGHCGGGPGADAFTSAFSTAPQPPTLDAGHDVFTALIDWSNGAAPPERITATRFLPRSPTQIDFQRPLCAYPKMPAPGTDHSSGTGGNIVCLSSR